MRRATCLIEELRAEVSAGLCIYCERPLTHPQSKYTCGRAGCLAQYHRDYDAGRWVAGRRCRLKGCGRTVKRGRRGRPKFCCDAHRQRHHNRKVAEQRRRRRRRKRCLLCRAILPPNRNGGGKPQKWCKRKCRRKAAKTKEHAHEAVSGAGEARHDGR